MDSLGFSYLKAGCHVETERMGVGDMCGVWETMIQCSVIQGDDSSQVITEVMLVVAQGREQERDRWL